MLNVLKRSFSVASLHLRHSTPICFKATDSCPVVSRSFQTTDLNLMETFRNTKEDTRLDRAAEDLSVDIANVFLERIKIDNYHPQVQFIVS